MDIQINVADALARLRERLPAAHDFDAVAAAEFKQERSAFVETARTNLRRLADSGAETLTKMADRYGPKDLHAEVFGAERDFLDLVSGRTQRLPLAVEMQRWVDRLSVESRSTIKVYEEDRLISLLNWSFPE